MFFVLAQIVDPLQKDRQATLPATTILNTSDNN